MAPLGYRSLRAVPGRALGVIMGVVHRVDILLLYSGIHPLEEGTHILRPFFLTVIHSLLFLPSFTLILDVPYLPRIGIVVCQNEYIHSFPKAQNSCLRGSAE